MARTLDEPNLLDPKFEADSLPYLLENPEERERLRDDPGLLKSAVEELLRYGGERSKSRIDSTSVATRIHMFRLGSAFTTVSEPRWQRWRVRSPLGHFSANSLTFDWRRPPPRFAGRRAWCFAG